MSKARYSAARRDLRHLGTRDLGNRRSIRLSYGGNGRNPSFLRLPGQRETRETRKVSRFAVTQQAAQSVRLSFHLSIADEPPPRPVQVFGVDVVRGPPCPIGSRP